MKFNFFNEYPREIKVTKDVNLLNKRFKDYSIGIESPLQKHDYSFKEPKPELVNLFLSLWHISNNYLFIKSSKNFKNPLSQKYNILIDSGTIIDNYWENVNIPILACSTEKLIFKVVPDDELTIVRNEEKISTETIDLYNLKPLIKNYYSLYYYFKKFQHGFFKSNNYEFESLENNGYKTWSQDCDLYLLGFWNYAENSLFLLEEINKKELERIKDIIKENYLYKCMLKTSNNPFKIGLEMEFLTKKEGNVISATEIYVNIIDKVFGIPEKSKQELIRIGNRDLTNYLFMNSNLGCDGRRILGETRFFPQTINIKDSSYIKAINSFVIQLKNYFYIIHHNEPNLELRLGGGEQGETIGSHFHFSLPLNKDFIKILHIVFGYPLQNMKGGKRPEMINPPDHIVYNDNDRHINRYGVIRDELIIDTNHPEDIIRTKVYKGKDKDETGWEYRPCPSFQINKVFTKNIFLTLFQLLKLDAEKKDIEISQFDLKNIINLFGYFPPVIEYYFMTKTLNLEINPLLYWIKSKRNELKKRIIITKGININTNVDYFKEYLVDYIPVRNDKRMFFKISKSRKPRLEANKKLEANLAILFKTYSIDIPIELKDIPINSFRIYLPNDEYLINIAKSCCLSY